MQDGDSPLKEWNMRRKRQVLPRVRTFGAKKSGTAKTRFRLLQEKKTGLFFQKGEVNAMKNYQKYSKQYFLPPVRCMDWAEKDAVDRAPVWCSVDLRDGNQALIEPMTLGQKVEFFKLLLKIGFKEIEVGFPAASDTEYAFLRTLIDNHLIPDDVTVQVLTQAREHIIRKTFEAIAGAKKRHCPRLQFHVRRPARAGL